MSSFNRGYRVRGEGLIGVNEMTTQTHEVIKAFSYSSLPAIRDIVDAYELLVSPDLVDPTYLDEMSKVNSDIDKSVALAQKEYEDKMEEALNTTVVSKPVSIKRSHLRRKFQIVYALFQRKGLIIRQEVYAQL